MKINTKSMDLLQESVKNLSNEKPLSIKEIISIPSIHNLLDEAFNEYKEDDTINYSDLEKFLVDDKVFDLVLFYLTELKNLKISGFNEFEEEENSLSELEMVDYATSSRNNDPVGLLLKEINQKEYDQMTAEEEKEKFLAYIKSKEENDGVGDPLIKQEIVQRNIKLVISIAKRYSKKMHIGDLINVGVKGLDIAVDRFDPSKGYKFSTYSTWWIRQSITRFLSSEQRLIRLPVHLNEEINKVQSKINQYETLNGVTPTTEELAELTGYTEEKVKKIIDIEIIPRSLQSPVSNDTEDSSELQDFVVDPKQSIESIMEQKDCLKMFVKALCMCLEPDKGNYLAKLKGVRVIIERKGINLFDEALRDDPNAIWLINEFVSYFHLPAEFFNSNEPKTLEIIGDEMGVTRERIRQIESKTVRKLRNPKRYRYFKDYVGIPGNDQF